MRVAQIARRARVSPDTVRHYAREGLLNPRRNPTSGYREFSESDLVRLRFIIASRQLDFSIDEIRRIFECADHGGSPCSQVRRCAVAHLEAVRAQLRDLQEMERRLSEALALWQTLPDHAPDGEHVCGLIDSWANARGNHLAKGT